MTANAKLPKTSQRQSLPAHASDLAVGSLGNKIAIGRAKNWVATTRPISRPNGEQRAEFQGAAVRKVTTADACGCTKSELRSVHTNPVCPGRHLIGICAKQFQCTPLSWLLVSAKRAATNSTSFASVWQLSKQNSAQRCREKNLFGLLWRAQMTHSATAVCAHGRSAARRRTFSLGASAARSFHSKVIRSGEEPIEDELTLHSG